MRCVLALLAFLASPALAAGWSHYENERFGVAVDIPPGFKGEQLPENGDGRRFTMPGAELAVFGSLVAEGDFEGEVRQRMGWRQDDGWTITYQAVTPRWASYSGTKGGRVFYARAISMCDGAVIGAFELEYGKAQMKAFDPIVAHLVESLGDSGNGWQC